MFTMKKCSVYLVVAGVLCGCATPKSVVPAPGNSASLAAEIVTPIVKSVAQLYSERGGAAKYSHSQQHMLVLRPETPGEYVKLEDAKRPSDAGFTEFKIPPPKVTATQSISREIVIFFKFNSSELTQEAKRLLVEVASSSPGAVIVSVNGFTDSKGIRASNDELSKERSAVVVKALGDAGINTSSITENSFGSGSPIDDNNTLAGRARNRRVEIKIVGETLPIDPKKITSTKSIL